MEPQIPKFDVEPVDTKRIKAGLFGIGSSVSGLLAIIGWPVPVFGGRYGQQSDAWTRTLTSIDDWFSHDGWRFSGASWLWGGLAVSACLAAIISAKNGSRWTGKKWLIAILPGLVLAIAGSLIQTGLGVPWSNYEPS